MPTTIMLRHITKTYHVHLDTEKQPSLTHSLAGDALTAIRGDTDLEALPEHKNPSVIHAVDDVSFTVRPGETLSILGPSGCGKTTLLRIVAGLEQPDSGEILYDGVELDSISPKERGVGMVFQNYALYPHMPNLDNIGFFLKLRKREIEVPERVQDISRFMQIDLEPLLSRRPPTLSGGERQRVAIARCLARDPKVFLFDEPFSNLDAKLRMTARIELNRLLRRYQVTSIYVTHDQTEAIALSQRIAIINHGALVQIGTFKQLYDTPVNTFVASFLGKPPMNLFPGYARNGVWTGRAFEWSPIRTDLEDGQRIVLGVRPEHLLLDQNGFLKARVDLVEPIFTDRVQLVHVKIGPHRAIARIPLNLQVTRGDEISLSIQPDQVHLFDQHTGKRLG